ncbi:hypothetical protein CAP35_10325 [Chitinophagaceae bacterium IBVUCB1]|nr:hypothetical protein CAP35_10325 [Chitinophagaceae bacterium IBVUCB1]
MPTNKLHIISFDVPYPPDYGGAIDVYYKIKALHNAGAEIYLHCFAYGRQPSLALQSLCKEVWYYPRKTGVAGMSLSLPYIVNSRRSEALLQRLMSINAPILFEGIHSTYYINHPALAGRKKAIRAHNIEGEYYKLLAAKEPNMLKRAYYNIEATFANKYERNVNADIWLPLSMEDEKHFSQLHPKAKHQFIAPFHPYSSVETLLGSGTYCLYHGNLSHPENIEAALFLTNEVFNYIDTPLIIAGRQPDNRIANAIASKAHCKLIANPDEATMQQLITDAHIHILPTFQQSGMKLKLLYALFKGRHIVANKEMLYGTGLHDACHIATDANSFKQQIQALMQQPFAATDIEKRSSLLAQNYNNDKNAAAILTWLQG